MIRLIIKHTYLVFLGLFSALNLHSQAIVKKFEKFEIRNSSGKV